MDRSISTCLTVFIFFGVQYFTLNEISEDSFSSRYFGALFVSILSFAFVNDFLYVQELVKISFNRKDSKNDFLNSSQFMYRFVECFCTMTVIIVSFITIRRQKKVLRYFDSIRNIAQENLSLKIDYHAFIKEFSKKTSIFAGLLLLFMAEIVYVLYMDNQKSVRNARTRSWLYLIRYGAVLKFVFFADLMTFHMSVIDSYLRNLIKNMRYDSSIDEKELNRKIRCNKRMFGIIYKISKQMDKSFGWINLSILLFGVTALMFIIFSTLLAIKQNRSIYFILCKFLKGKYF